MRGEGESSDFSGTFVARQQLISSQEILKSGACESTRKCKGARVLKSPSEDPNGSFSNLVLSLGDSYWLSLGQLTSLTSAHCCSRGYEALS